jgi:Skp family chaperone for outer membrane proteins
VIVLFVLVVVIAVIAYRTKQIGVRGFPRSAGRSPETEKLEAEIDKRYAPLNGEMEQARRRKAELETKIRNLTRAIEDGMDSPAIRAAITEREAEISKLTGKTLGKGKGSVRKQMVGLRKFVKESLGDIRELLTGKHANTSPVKGELARHIEGITLLPEGDNEIRYKGQWKLLGGTECAEGPDRTQRLTVEFQITIAA